MAIKFPPEWHPQQAVLLTWPRVDGAFAAMYAEAERCFVDIARAIAPHTPLIISCDGDPEALGERLRAAGVDAARLRIHATTSDDVWVRDHGPISILDDGRLTHLDFRFNGWGGKFPAHHDDRITASLDAAGLLPGQRREVDYVLEGGALETDGEGSLLTTSRCLLAASRNGDTDRAEVARQLIEWLGVERVLWLDHGDLIGDDTDGHIDTLARFCDAQTIAFQACEAPGDPHFESLSAMAEQLAALRRPDGQPYHLIPLPLPAPIHDEDGRRLPAGYANFLITNGAVLVPTYDDPADAVALERLRRGFPDHQVIGIDCRPLIHQYGSLHCATMQIPEAGDD